MESIGRRQQLENPLAASGPVPAVGVRARYSLATAPPTVFRELIHGVDGGRGKVRLSRRLPGLVAARRLRPLNHRFFDAEGTEE
jgi:hypothetical protein